VYEHAGLTRASAVVTLWGKEKKKTREEELTETKTEEKSKVRSVRKQTEAEA
jgi:hypothetical protein